MDVKSTQSISTQMVIDYLRLKHKQMPRTAFRYALEKIDTKTKEELMSLT